MSDIVVTEANKGGPIGANVGDTLVIRLPETPTTGFRWVRASVDTNILESRGDDFQIGAQSWGGGGGNRVFRFVTKGQGSTSLEFKLTRSWEANPPKAVFDVRVTVNLSL